MEVVPGRPDINVPKMIRMIEKAKGQGVDLIAFPEMCVGGYLVGDKWLEDSFCRDLMSYNEQIMAASNGIAIAFGNVYIDPNEAINKRTGEENGWHPNKDGRARRYNAIYVVQNGKPVQKANETAFLPEGVLAKTLLPTYRFFDDERYFFSLQDVAKDFGVSLESLLQPFVINIRGTKIPVGFELCEDLWCEDYRENKKSMNPSKTLVKNGAQLIVNLSASPWTYGKNAARDRRVKFIAQDIEDKFVPFLYVNCMGVQNNGKNIVTFDGGSTVYNTNGEPVVLSKGAYEEEMIIVTNKDFTRSAVERKEKSKIEQKYEAIVRGIKHLASKVVIGLSGGVDSSLVAALCVEALGSENVLGVNMPYIWNSKETKNAAKHVATQLNIGYKVIPIGESVGATVNTLTGSYKKDSKEEIGSREFENIQAKIRAANILSNLAQHYGALYTCNGNKVEIATGYFTVDGDGRGGLCPIADLLKVEIFEMARYVNQRIGREIIPKILLPDELYNFKLPPTAELKKKQIDPFKWGYHDALLEQFTDYRKKTPEDVLIWYLNGELEKRLGISTALIKRWNVNNPKEFVEDLEQFWTSIQNSSWKRVQSPPIIVLSKSAYGYDIREPILRWKPTQEYSSLKSEVLKLKAYSGVA